MTRDRDAAEGGDAKQAPARKGHQPGPEGHRPGSVGINTPEPETPKLRYHVEGQTSAEGQRWQIWDGERHFARFRNIADFTDANNLCDALNEARPTPTPAPGESALADEMQVYYIAKNELAMHFGPAFDRTTTEAAKGISQRVSALRTPPQSGEVSQEQVEAVNEAHDLVPELRELADQWSSYGSAGRAKWLARSANLIERLAALSPPPPSVEVGLAQDQGVSATPPGSREPDQQAVPALRASIPDAVWTTRDTVAGHLAMWAIRQSPYAWPDSLEAALVSFRAAFPGDSCDLSSWAAEDDLEAAIWTAMEASPAVLAWNLPKSGHDAPFVFSSRYDQPAPDDDFIDLHALCRNVASSVWLEERDAQGIEAGTATTGTGVVHESPVLEEDAPNV